MELLIIGGFLLAAAVGFYNALLLFIGICTLMAIYFTGAWIYLLAGLIIWALFK